MKRIAICLSVLIAGFLIQCNSFHPQAQTSSTQVRPGRKASREFKGCRDPREFRVFRVPQAHRVNREFQGRKAQPVDRPSLRRRC